MLKRVFNIKPQRNPIFGKNRISGFVKIFLKLQSKIKSSLIPFPLIFKCWWMTLRLYTLHLIHFIKSLSVGG